MIELFEDQTPRALELIEGVHGLQGTLAPEYPLVFGEGFAGRTLGVGEEGEVQAACGLLVRDLAIPSQDGGTRLRVGLIGSVSTGAAFRGRGLATRLIVEAEARLQSDGCAAVFLWADDPRFYLKRGFAPVGCEEDVLLPAVVCSRLPDSSSARRFVPADAAAVHALYSGHPARVERTQEETAALLTCPRMDALVLERDGEVVAYALRGRGRDLSEVIHEWGGATQGVLALLRAHLERAFESKEPGALILMAPHTESELLGALDALGCQRTTGILGLGKLLDREAAAHAVAERLGVLGSARVAVGQDEAGNHLHGLHLAGPAGECFLDDEAALALLFAPATVRASARALLENIGIPDAELPLEPFFWGLDSI